ncbi:protein kinase [candidate division KSB1 bacterium]|nr:protein kinase [candidate division KSB1 bacterium]
MDDWIGKTVSHYKIVEKLGQGGMGVVYKAEDTRLKRTVALKFLPPGLIRDETAKQRFIQEAQAASALDHQNICTIHQINETSGHEIFIVMACYEGQTLQALIESASLDIKNTVDIVAQIAEGLREAHDRGIIHRDIKPANIIVTSNGTVKIMDFGLAKLTFKEHSVTGDGSMVGTTLYLSPEQIRGEAVDARTDIWALGCIFYEMLSGEKPFSGDYPEALIYSILNEDPKPLNRFPNYGKIILKCLNKAPTARYDNLEAFQNDIGIPSSLSRAPGLFHFKRKPKIAIITAIALIVLLILISLFNRTLIQQWTGLKRPAKEKYLAILPFSNVGGDSSRQIFCDGLTEIATSKITALQQFRDYLWVVPCSEVKKRKIASPAEARREFGVNLVTTGTIQWQDQLVSLAINLIDTKNLRQLDAAVIDCNLENLTSIRDRVVQTLANMLTIEVHPGDWEDLFAGETRSPRAYRCYVEARGHLLRYEQLDNLNAAIELLNKSLIKDRQFALAHAALAEAYLRKFQIINNKEYIQKAEYNGKLALQLNEHLPPIQYTMGLIYKETGKYHQAIDLFSRAIGQNQSFSQAFSELAECYERLGMLQKAETTYKKSIELKPGYWSGYNMLGKFYVRHGRLQEAKKQFQRVVGLTPDNVRGYNNLGAIYFFQKNYSQAQKMWERSLSIEKSYAAYSNLGTACFYGGNYRKASKMYENALSINDTNYMIWGNLASCYFWNQEKERKWRNAFGQACRLAQQHLDVNPEAVEVMVDLAGYYAQLQKNEQALELLEQAIAIKPTTLSVIFRIGDTYEQLGDRKNALQYIGKAVQKGYSLAEIENNPGLEDLRKDARFKDLFQEK